MHRLSYIFLLFLNIPLLAQDPFGLDTLHLPEITIEAYQYQRPALEVPVSLGVLLETDLNRFGSASILPAVNTLPGVRMEERSPGSYRFAIRGSSLRSPFGVRNVKIYWNDLPFTDAGGNSYLNLFDFSAIQEIEIIKGPGSSLYGAGTGGVLFLTSTPKRQSGINIGTQVGSFGSVRYSLSGNIHQANSDITIQYAHQEAEGYREQTQLNRDFFRATGNFIVNEKGAIATSVLYSDLLYGTPGALTKQQYQENAKQARPAGGPFPGSVDQQAAVNNKTFYSSIAYDYSWNDSWSTKTGFYGSFTQFRNSAIRNLELKTEQGFGARTNTQYAFKKGRLNFGAEFQHLYSPVKVYENNLGVSGTLQNDDELYISTSLVFAQCEIFLPADFFLTLGVSVNDFDVEFTSFSQSPPFQEDGNFNLVLTPRVALLRKMSDALSLFASYSRGYSPPTIQELYPSTAMFYKDLNPENGDNFELGMKGQFFNKKLITNTTLYNFILDKTIVGRRTQDGADYFVNAGRTKQKGIETELSWTEKYKSASFKSFITYSYNHYRYGSVEKNDISFKDKKLPGISPHVLTVGVDASAHGLYTNVTATYTDKMPLDDANTEYATAYTLLGLQMGYKKTWHALTFNIYGGVDNLLDEKYSLGNDINAMGGRFYNVAAPINYFAGLNCSYTF